MTQDINPRRPAREDPDDVETESDGGPKRYTIETGYRLDGADGECLNCGIGLTEAPVHEGVHRIRMLYHTDPTGGSLVCEACYFDSYSESGADIVDRSGSLKPETFYEARKHREGEPSHHYDRYYFESYQAASYWARENGGEYLGGREVDPFKLQEVA